MKPPFPYRMVQVPLHFSVGVHRANAIAEKFQKMVDLHVAKGWEFFRMDAFKVTDNPGCFSFGTPTSSSEYVITLRAPYSQPPLAQANLAAQAAD